MRRMRPDERFAAWLVTGPAGHLVAGLTDFTVLFVRYWSTRIGTRARP
jgi:hypothetical protein